MFNKLESKRRLMMNEGKSNVRACYEAQVLRLVPTATVRADDHLLFVSGAFYSGSDDGLWESQWSSGITDYSDSNEGF